MKQRVNRGLSLLLAIAMCISILSGMVFTASAVTVDYVTVGSYILNWGSRGTAATFLSPNAEAFYSDNEISYSDLSLLSGSSDAASVPNSALYAELQELMKSNHSYKTSYDGTKELYKYTDCQNNDCTSDGAISSFYSGKGIGPKWDSGATWNREHTWPNSKGLGGSDENDIMMLRPTSTTENGSRSNTAYGESSGFFDPNSVSGGTYNLHGDVARIALYVYVRWGNTGYMWGSSGVMESKEVLLKWMQEDPVDTWELGRNDAVESITGTRNVFVDYPELAFLLFNEEVPADMTTPSGEAFNSGSAYTITATTNNAAYGTVSVSGKTINAVPAEGYRASGCTVVSGSASVTQNGNAFTVNAASDCTVQINFEPKSSVTVSFLEDGSVASFRTVYSGDSVTLPDHTGAVPADYTFVGWAETAVDHTETVPALLKTGSSYTVEDDTLLYAVYSYVGESSGTGIWTLVTDASILSAGDQLVIAYNSKGVAAGEIVTASNPYMATVNTVFSDDLNTIPALPADVVVLTLGGSEGAWTLANAGGQLLGATAAKKMAWDKGTTTWGISVANGNAAIQNTTAAYGSLEYNISSPRFTTYLAGSNQNAPQLYVLDTGAGTTYYTTATSDTCQHDNTINVPAKDATCTENGYTSGIFCDDCKTYLSGHTAVTAPGHSYTAEITPPTATTDGFTTYTCSACGDSYTGNTVPALGETYTVSFAVPDGVAAVADMPCNNSGIILPAAGVPTGSREYTFVGWTPVVVENATTAPTVFTAGSSYVAEADTTLHALYSYGEGGSGESSYVLVESADQLTGGAKVVIASSAHDIAMSTSQGSSANNRGTVSITKNDDKTISFASDAGVAVMELQAGTVDGTYAFYCPVNNGYLYASSSSSNVLKLQKTNNANGSFKIEIGENGACTVTAQGDNTRNLLRYNSGSSIFSCYKSGQTAVSLYIETVDGTLCYTTVISQPHVHSGVYQPAAAATCQREGTVAHYACACGKNFSDSACTIELSSTVDPQKDHDYTAEIVQEKYLQTPANCHAAALYCYSCTMCGAASDAVFSSGGVDASNHDGETEVRGAFAATCTAEGYTGDTYCLGCGGKTDSGSDIPATGHADAAFLAGSPSTCKATGTKGHYHCDACGKDYLVKDASAKPLTADDLQLPLDPDNHDGERELRGAFAATCTTAGYTGDICCTGCDATIVPGSVIPAGHTLEKVDGKPATHEADGNIEYFVCSVCGKLYADEKAEKEITEADTVIPKGEHAYGDFTHDASKHWKACACGSKIEEGTHTYGAWTTVKSAGVGVEGSKERTCSVCGYKQTEKLPAIANPDTGDASHIVVWTLLLLTSACAVVYVTTAKKRYPR